MTGGELELLVGVVQETAGEVALLQALADTTAVAIENARLYGALRARIESLNVFAYALAHDLREPVRTTRSFSDLLLREAPGVDRDELSPTSTTRACGWSF